MSAADHLSPHQFMPVSDLLHMQSTDALINREYETKVHYNKIPRDDRTTVQALYSQKAAHIAENPTFWHGLDEPIRKGTIDPVVLSHEKAGLPDSVAEGHHRIVRAHQLGVQRLPVTHDWTDQPHEEGWKNDQADDDMRRAGMLGVNDHLDNAVSAYHQNRGK